MTTSAGRAAVIVPVRDEAATLGAQLNALDRVVAQEAGDWSVEIVVVDNGSTDDTPRVAASWEQRGAVARVLTAATPGTAAACNEAVRRTPADVFLFAHGDDVVEPGWLAGHLDAFSTGADITAGAWWTPARDGRRDRPRTTITLWGRSYALGANHGVHRRVFDAVGGYDEGVLAEDAEFCWRAAEAGFPVTEVPNAVTRRGVPVTAVGRFRKSLGYGRGQRRLLARGWGSVPDARREALGRLARVLLRPDALLHEGRRGPWCDTAGSALGLLLPTGDVPRLRARAARSGRSG